MDLLLIFFLLFAAFGSAQTQSFGALPSCAVSTTPPLNTHHSNPSSNMLINTPSQQNCATTLPANCNLDPKCICADSSFIVSISCCVGKACSQSEVQKTLQVAQQLCSTVKVKLPDKVPDSCGATGGSGGGGGNGNSASSSVKSQVSSSATSKSFC